MKKILTAISTLFFFCFYLHAQSIGSKVSFSAVDGKSYTCIVKEIQGNQYKVKYDGYDFEAWLTKDQFQVVDAAPVSNSSATITAAATDLQGIFYFGRRQGWVTPVQESYYARYITPLSDQDKSRLLQFFMKAHTNSARYFVMASWMCHDPIATLEQFINELNAYPESVQQEKCLMSSHRSVIQQWQNTCAITTVEVFLADLCPRYAWELKQVPNFNIVANDPNNAIASQQKQLIEKYGAPAAARGDNAAKYIAINGALDELVSLLLGVHFITQQVNEPLTNVLSKIRSELDRGIDTPLLVEFTGTSARHFMLVMKYREVQGQYQYLIYDPWDGVCDYVQESMILSGSMYPLLAQWKIGVDYYYRAN